MFAHLSSKERIAYVSLFLVFMLAAGYVGQRQFKPRPPIIVQELPSTRSTETQVSPLKSDTEVTVDVEGAIRKPGVYKLAGGSRVCDAVKVAEGMTQNADAERLNLAAKLIDSTQVYVPKKSLEGPNALGDPSYQGGPGSTPTYESTPAAPSSGKSGAKHPTSPVALNSATAEQLESIPGIGPSTAQRIVDYRTQHGAFKSVEELTAVGGIGPKKLERMKPYLRL